MLNTILRTIERFIPKKLYRLGQPIYHWKLALLGALFYRFPSRSIKVVAVTGTKGKSSTVELINAVLEEAGYTTAVLGTIRFKIADKEERNLYKMTIPGRFFVQRFLRRAVSAGCDWAILEMTSEGAKQFRHKWIDFDALVFTNLAPEHIESHGSYEKYRDAKLSIARQLAKSHKNGTVIVANADDPESGLFLRVGATYALPFSLSQANVLRVGQTASTFSYKGVPFEVPLAGQFNVYNALAAIVFCESQNIPLAVIAQGLSRVQQIRGRAEFIREGQDFDVVVDYAHTPDSLMALYGAFKESTNICVLGNTGGGRDTWKRPEMAHIAEEYCAHMILTNEDPYDEDPKKILDEMAAGVESKEKLHIILDRREAIREALKSAAYLRAQDRKKRVAVLITGKGTDPYIMGPRGEKLPWDDATVVREELKALH
ncbi:MAG: UDP-N-acetylmuramoyl-L-alanyl-D-glutamate--2,6-diaminopimelate ligase [Candidatus Campbellbacteria bacterium]